MVSHDTFKNIVLFALVIAFLYFLFRDRINVLTEEMSVSSPTTETSFFKENNQLESNNKSGAMNSENTGIDRSLIKSDEEMGILSTCQQNSGGELVKNCSDYAGYNFDYDKSFDKFLRPTSLEQPNFLKSTGL